MKIKYLGHACFLISGNKNSFAIDPFGNIGYEQERVTADYCLCSHLHFDHFATDYVNAKNFISEKTGESFKGLEIIDSYHDEVNGAKRGRNRIYKFECDGVLCCHLGDLGQPFSQDLVEKIGKVNLLMIPIGGNYTINALEAEKYVKAINPQVVIPMHYKTKRSDIDIDSKSEFLKLFSPNVIVKKAQEFNFDLSELKKQLTIVDINDDNF